MSWLPSRATVISWAGLLALLGLTIFLAYQPLANFNLMLALMIAISKSLIVAAVFMELRERSGLMIAFAAAGFLWLGILIWLSGADFVSRPEFPPIFVQ
jgi:cytochrome c oxidase subunit 4